MFYIALGLEMLSCYSPLFSSLGIYCSFGVLEIVCGFWPPCTFLLTYKLFGLQDLLSYRSTWGMDFLDFILVEDVGLLVQRPPNASLADCYFAHVLAWIWQSKS